MLDNWFSTLDVHSNHIKASKIGLYLGAHSGYLESEPLGLCLDTCTFQASQVILLDQEHLGLQTRWPDDPKGAQGLEVSTLFGMGDSRT